MFQKGSEDSKVCVSAGVIQNNHQGKIHYAYLIFLSGIILLLSVMLLSNKMVLMAKDKADNVLTIAAFSGSICNYPDMTASMKVFKEKGEEQVTYDFERMLAEMTIIIDEDRAEQIVNHTVMQNVLPQNSINGRDNNYGIDSVIVYNVGKGLDVFQYENQTMQTNHFRKYGEYNYIHSPNGVLIDRTSLYVKIHFTFCDVFNREKLVFMEKCIALKFANE